MINLSGSPSTWHQSRIIVLSDIVSQKEQVGASGRRGNRGRPRNQQSTNIKRVATVPHFMSRIVADVLCSFGQFYCILHSVSEGLL